MGWGGVQWGRRALCVCAPAARARARLSRPCPSLSRDTPRPRETQPRAPPPARMCVSSPAGAAPAGRPPASASATTAPASPAAPSAAAVTLTNGRPMDSASAPSVPAAPRLPARLPERLPAAPPARLPARLPEPAEGVTRTRPSAPAAAAAESAARGRRGSARPPGGASPSTTTTRAPLCRAGVCVRGLCVCVWGGVGCLDACGWAPPNPHAALSAPRTHHAPPTPATLPAPSNRPRPPAPRGAAPARCRPRPRTPPPAHLGIPMLRAPIACTNQPLRARLGVPMFRPALPRPSPTPPLAWGCQDVPSALARPRPQRLRPQKRKKPAHTPALRSPGYAHVARARLDDRHVGGRRRRDEAVPGREVERRAPGGGVGHGCGARGARARGVMRAEGCSWWLAMWRAGRPRHTHNT